VCPPFAAVTEVGRLRNCPNARSVTSVRRKPVHLWHMMSRRIFNVKNIAENNYSLLSPDPICGICRCWLVNIKRQTAVRYNKRKKRSARIKPLLSSNVRKLCSQTAWWSSFFLCHSVIDNLWYDLSVFKVPITQLYVSMARCCSCWPQWI